MPAVPFCTSGLRKREEFGDVCVETGLHYELSQASFFE